MCGQESLWEWESAVLEGELKGLSRSPLGWGSQEDAYWWPENIMTSPLGCCCLEGKSVFSSDVIQPQRHWKQPSCCKQNSHRVFTLLLFIIPNIQKQTVLSNSPQIYTECLHNGILMCFKNKRMAWKYAQEAMLCGKSRRQVPQGLLWCGPKCWCFYFCSAILSPFSSFVFSKFSTVLEWVKKLWLVLFVLLCV